MPPVTFRPLFNRVLSIVIWALLGAACVGVLFGGAGTLPLLPGVPLGSIGAALLVWALLWSPCLVVDDEAVRVTNILTRHVVPWAALIHLETRYSLTLHTPGRRVRVTAAPAPGQLTALRASRQERRRLNRLGASAGGVRPGDLPGTDSGDAAELVRGRWERLRDSGRIEAGVADRVGVPVTVRPGAVAALVLGLSALVAAALLV